MKKLWMGLTAAALVMSLCVTGALAAGRHGLRRTNAGVCGTWGTACSGFVDADSDGVCDYRDTVCGINFTDADGDGICDNCGTHRGGFVDTDGDGVCDYFGTGLGSRSGGHHGRGTCRNQ